MTITLKTKLQNKYITKHHSLFIIAKDKTKKNNNNNKITKHQVLTVTCGLVFVTCQMQLF